MGSISAALCLLQFHQSVSLMLAIYKSKHWISVVNEVDIIGAKFQFGSSRSCLSWNPRKLVEQSFFVIVNSSLGSSSDDKCAAGDGDDVEMQQQQGDNVDSRDLVTRFRGITINTLNPVVFVVAIFMVLAMTFRRKLDVLTSILPTLRENPKYQGQDKLPFIVWMILIVPESVIQ